MYVLDMIDFHVYKRITLTSTILGEFLLLMKEILGHIETEKQKFARLPFLTFLQDSTIDPKHRLAFAPCAAPFIVSFGELNSKVFRVEPTQDSIQAIINQHSYEDDCHWIWFLEDLEKIGLNPQYSFADTLRFLWGEELSLSRRLSLELYRLTTDTTPLNKLVIISVIEATGNVFLEASSQVINALDPNDKMGLKYFSSHHLDVDAQHDYILGKKFSVDDVHITDSQRVEIYELINQVFALFTNFVAQLLSFAESQKLNPSICANIFEESGAYAPLGQYLIEAQIITNKQLQEALNIQKTISVPIGQILSIKGWVKQGTIDFLMEKVIVPERRSKLSNNSARMSKNDTALNNSTPPINYEPPYPGFSRLGTYLIDAELITTPQLDDALEEQKLQALPLGQILSSRGIINQHTIEYLMDKVVIPDRNLVLQN